MSENLVGYLTPRSGTILGVLRNVGSGRGIASVDIDENYYLVVTYTDGTTWSSDPTSIQGSEGPKGDTGATGPKGDKGDKGDTGDTGATGPKGDKGDTGATGPQGPQGSKGDKGDKGDTGSTGAAAGFGTISATVDSSVGTPSVEVTTSGTDTAKNFSFAFHNLKGQDGTGSGTVTDVLQNGTSVLDGSVAKVTVPTKTSWYGTCSTASTTLKKIVTTTTGDFSLTTGNTVTVTFTNKNTLSTSALNVDSTGDKSIRILTGSLSSSNCWRDGETVTFVYDGTYFLAVGVTVLNSSVSSTETNTAATSSAVKQAYDLANGKQNALVSGTNIKTINNTSLLGSGDITIGGATNWVDGSATGSVRTVGSWAEDSSYTMGADAVAEGNGTEASGDYSHAEGHDSQAIGESSHAEGANALADGAGAHAEGADTAASGVTAHAEGSETVASGDFSHAGGVGTTAQRASQQVFGEYNILDTGGSDETTRGDYVEIVGNGDAWDSLSNARTLDWDGNEELAGALMTNGDIIDMGILTVVDDADFGADVVVSGTLTVNADPSTNMEVATKQYADTKQAQLVSGTNIKTVNSTSLLGSGDITVQPTLVSGTNIKTVNSTSLLGSGDVSVQPTLVSGTNIKTVNSTSLLGSGDIAVQPTLVSGTNIKTINNESLLGSGNISIQSGTPISTETVTITVANWNATTTCTKSVTGVTASNSVIVSPAPASMAAYTSSGVYCSAQGSGTLTFTASSTPSADITVNVMIIG